MKTYISGKITGLTEAEARSNFKRAENYLHKLGHKTVNPMTIVHNHDKSWENFMREDLKAMFDCDTIFMLQGWRKSKGARIEYELARHLKMKIIIEKLIK